MTNLMTQCMTDIFPDTVATTVACTLCYPEKKFKYVDSYPNVRVFLLFMDSSNKIYYQKRKFEDKAVQNLNYVGQNCMELKDFRPYDVSWNNVAKKFRESTNDAHRQNTGSRVGFKIGNAYLVKTYFTFGQRTVRPGTAHVFQVLNVPLLFLLLEEKTKAEKLGTPLTYGDRRFPYQDFHLYDRRVLPPNGVYRIPAGTTYLVVSLSKNFFALDVMMEDARLPFERVVDAVADVEATAMRNFLAPRDMPAQTPFIENNEEEQEEERRAVRYLQQQQQLVHEQQQQQQQQQLIYEQQQRQQQQAQAFEWVFVPQQQFVENHETLQTPVLETQQTPEIRETEVMDEPEVVAERPAPQRNICTVSLPFVEYFNSLTSKTYDNPTLFENGMGPDASSPEQQPLDLSCRMDFADVEQMLEVDEHGQYEDMMNSLTQSLRQ